MKKTIIALLALLGVARFAHADVRLPAALGDHMVLQQNCEVTLWGWAYAGETVLIETSWGVKTQIFTLPPENQRVAVRRTVTELK